MADQIFQSHTLTELTHIANSIYNLIVEPAIKDQSILLIRRQDEIYKKIYSFLIKHGYSPIEESSTWYFTPSEGFACQAIGAFVCASLKIYMEGGTSKRDSPKLYSKFLRIWDKIVIYYKTNVNSNSDYNEINILSKAVFDVLRRYDYVSQIR